MHEEFSTNTFTFSATFQFWLLNTAPGADDRVLASEITSEQNEQYHKVFLASRNHKLRLMLSLQLAEIRNGFLHLILPDVNDGTGTLKVPEGTGTMKVPEGTGTMKVLEDTGTMKTTP